MVARIAITADTNVYVSALHFGGKPRRVVEAARAGLIDLAVSDAILAEVDRVLRTKSGDKHLLRLGEFEGITIVPVAAFVDRFVPTRSDAPA